MALRRSDAIELQLLIPGNAEATDVPIPPDVGSLLMLELDVAFVAFAAAAYMAAAPYPVVPPVPYIAVAGYDAAEVPPVPSEVEVMLLKLWLCAIAPANGDVLRPQAKLLAKFEAAVGTLAAQLL